MHKHYVHRSARASRSWTLWGEYVMPVKAGMFNQASLEMRWDGLTSHSDSNRKDGVLTINHPARQRLTAGATLTYSYKAVRCDLRLDYEKYFCHDQRKAALLAAGDADKICAEMVIRF